MQQKERKWKSWVHRWVRGRGCAQERKNDSGQIICVCVCVCVSEGGSVIPFSSCFCSSFSVTVGSEGRLYRCRMYAFCVPMRAGWTTMGASACVSDISRLVSLQYVFTDRHKHKRNIQNECVSKYVPYSHSHGRNVFVNAREATHSNARGVQSLGMTWLVREILLSLCLSLSLSHDLSSSFPSVRISSA